MGHARTIGPPTRHRPAAAHAAGQIGDEVRRQREAGGLTRAAFARTAGIHPSHLGRIEDAEREASMSTLLGVARALEVPVSRPVRGVTDVVLHDPASGLLIAVESEGALPRLERQLHWSGQKAEGLAHDTRWSAPGLRRSSLLLLRSTTATRALAAAVPATFAAAFPAAPAAALASLESHAPWPGDALIWVTVDQGATRLLPGTPRGLVPHP